MTTPRGTGLPTLAIDHREVERRKQFRRDLWEYRRGRPHSRRLLARLDVRIHAARGNRGRGHPARGQHQAHRAQPAGLPRRLHPVGPHLVRIHDRRDDVRRRGPLGGRPRPAPGRPCSPDPRDRPDRRARAPGPGCRPDAGEPASPSTARGEASEGRVPDRDRRGRAPEQLQGPGGDEPALHRPLRPPRGDASPARPGDRRPARCVPRGHRGGGWHRAHDLCRLQHRVGTRAVPGLRRR